MFPQSTVCLSRCASLMCSSVPLCASVASGFLASRPHVGWRPGLRMVSRRSHSYNISSNFRRVAMCISGEKQSRLWWRRANCARRPVLTRAVHGSESSTRLIMLLADPGMLPRSPVTSLSHDCGGSLMSRLWSHTFEGGQVTNMRHESNILVWWNFIQVPSATVNSPRSKRESLAWLPSSFSISARSDNMTSASPELCIKAACISRHTNGVTT